jgi:hypothetical protein
LAKRENLHKWFWRDLDGYIFWKNHKYKIIILPETNTELLGSKFKLFTEYYLVREKRKEKEVL